MLQTAPAAAQECLLDTSGDGGATVAADTIAGASATGFFSTACGDGALADGDGSVAFGVDSEAAAFESVAVGAGAFAEEDFTTAVGGLSEASGVNSTALGNFTTASGDDSTAVGADAIASGEGATAVGEDAEAAGIESFAGGENSMAIGDNSIAIGSDADNSGDGAVAVGTNSTALGADASAAFANSTALGAGATSSADNQIAIGTASNTLTVSGITSQASRDAQSGPIEYVTADASGNLATDGGALSAGLNAVAQFGSDFATFQNRLDALDNLVEENREHIEENTDGVAMAMAMAGSGWLMPDEKFAVTANWGYYRASNAVAFSAAARISKNASFNAGVGVGAKKGEVGARAGVRMGW